MPVPETGPEMPLPLAASEAGAASKEKPAVDDDRRAVGNFLTRVFGSTPPEPAEEPAADENSLRAKAEKLARDTISGFAEEKLQAPAVGNALKADKEFMNEVASSLESALASSNEADVSDLPENAAGGSEPEAHAPAPEHPQPDMRLKEALAGDAQTSEVATAQKPEGEALSAETAALVAENVAQDEQPVSKPAVTTQSEAGKAEMQTHTINLPGSLEGSIKEMIKPLIIQWLNENLPRIVEEAVREELTGRGGTGS